MAKATAPGETRLMNFLADTNVILNFFKGKEPDKSFLTNLLSKNDLFISPINIAEISAFDNKDEQESLKKFITLGKVTPIDEKTALTAGDYRKKFSGKTNKVYLLDCLIAATCKIHSLTLLTNNTPDYPMKDIDIIKPHG